MMYKIIFLSLSLLSLSVFAMEEQPTSQMPASRQPFVWADLADSYALRTNLQTYAALPAALVSGIYYLAHADEIKAGRRSIKPGLITGSILAAGIIFLSPEFEAIRAEKKCLAILKEIEANLDLLKTNPQKMEFFLRTHSEAIHSLEQGLEKIAQKRYKRSELTGNLRATPRNQEFYTRCKELEDELEKTDRSIRNSIFKIEYRNI